MNLENDVDDGAELVSIDDPRVPDIIREHAAEFKTAVTHVACDGVNWVLFAEDGEVVDICSLKDD